RESNTVTQPSFTVVVPSYFRPDALRTCLLGLAQQLVKPETIFVVLRPEDLDAIEVVVSVAIDPPVQVLFVHEPGVLAAMAVGLRTSTTDWIAFTDDDAVPSPSWIANFKAAARPGLVGIGGRDCLVDGGVPRATTLTESVGSIGNWGQLTGNHHRGTGQPRNVAMLKGVNCAYRATLLGIPHGLRGTGAQVHFEVAIGLDLSRFGALRYDPSITVTHEPGERVGADGRRTPTPRAVSDVAANAVFAMTASGLGLALRRALFSLLIGDASCPGIVRAIVGLRDADIRSRVLPAMRGTIQAAWAVAFGYRIAFIRRD
ncbi:MAG: glycosyltransferase family A protein, partial [Actinomycetota bacterium]